jgi:outer membrane protein OmpA-like peptidoglycan-associated protein
VSKDPVKRKRPQPKPKPKPKPQVPLPDPPYLYLAVRDFDTEKPIDANVKMFKTIAPFDTVFVAKTDIKTGMTTTRLKSQPYGIIITRPGYIEYVDTLPGIYNDTVLVELQPIKENTIVILENLLFDFDKATLQNDSAQSLLELEKLMKENPSVEIEITGHTDNKGSQSYNRRLSERRARTVYDLMVQRGVDPKRMSYDGVGSREPIESNATEEGRAINRRVEFRIIYIDANSVNDTVLEEFTAETEEEAEKAETEAEAETEK